LLLNGVWTQPPASVPPISRAQRRQTTDPFQPKTTARRGAIRLVGLAPTKASAFRQLAPHLLSCRRPAPRLSKSRRHVGLGYGAPLEVFIAFKTPPHHHRVGQVLPLFAPRATSLCQANANSASSSAPIAIGATRKLHDMSLTTTTSGSIPAGG
jgi:hypothetical protein